MSICLCVCICRNARVSDHTLVVQPGGNKNNCDMKAESLNWICSSHFQPCTFILGLLLSDWLLAANRRLEQHFHFGSVSVSFHSSACSSLNKSEVVS